MKRIRKSDLRKMIMQEKDNLRRPNKTVKPPITIKKSQLREMVRQELRRQNKIQDTSVVDRSSRMKPSKLRPNKQSTSRRVGR